MMPIDLVLVRHGQSEANLANRRSEEGDHSAFTEEFKKRHPSSFRLTEHGRKQARQIGMRLKELFYRDGIGFDRCIVSEYNRAMETAGIINLPDAQWYRDVYLIERNWGDMEVCGQEERELKFADELRKRNVQPFFWKPPNGESFLELCLRIDRVLHTLHRECSDKRVIIVCHGEVIRAFQVRLERMSQERFKELTLSPTNEDQIYNCQSVHYTRRNPYTNRLEKYLNWVSHERVIEGGPLWSSGWTKIERKTYSNNDLIIKVNQEPLMIEV